MVDCENAILMMMDGQPVTHAELVEALIRQKQDPKREILGRVQEILRDSQTEILKAFLPYHETA